MSANRFADVERLYHEARTRPSEQRSAFLDEACGGDDALRQEVESLLALRTGADGFLSRPALEEAARMSHRLREPEAWPTIPGYVVKRGLGEGGMGVVYLAEQETPFRRLVALKLIKPGMDTRQVVARFETERQALALMDHPNIAAVFDAGSTKEGRPYFVMEYVDGISITEYCDRERLSTRDRLALFVQVCAAVQHAHQKGVIHRDLKPSNVLVAERDGRPLPKVIDFGTAKAIGAAWNATMTQGGQGMVLGTLEYMSPEQAALSADIDTATDVYSLGVLLYELLVGRLPFDADELRAAGYDEMRRVIRESDPPRPSVRVEQGSDNSGAAARARQTDAPGLTRQLRGDLDWITLKALEKPRERRYATVATFAEDVDRHLLNQPVQARPQSAVYRMGKFARRHRGVVAASAAVLMSLVAGFLTTAAMFIRSEDQRLEAIRLGYAAAIAAADIEIRVEQWAAARNRLFQAPEDLRRWEWWHLLIKTDPSIMQFRSSALCGLATPLPPMGPATAVVVSDTGQELFLKRCSTVDVWNLSTRQRQKTFAVPDERLMAILRSGEVVTKESSASAPGRTWRLTASPLGGGPGRDLGSFSSEPICTAFSTDQSLMAVGLAPRAGRNRATDTGHFEIWNLHTRRRTVPWIPARQSNRSVVLQSPKCAATFSSDSRFLATSDWSLAIWDTTTGAAGMTFQHNLFDYYAQPVAFSPDGQRVAVVSRDGTVEQLDVETGEATRFKGSGSRTVRNLRDIETVSAVAFSRDGRHLLSGSATGVTVWDRALGGLSHMFNGHSSPVNSIDFTIDGHAVTIDRDGNVRVWPRTTTGAVTVLQTSVSTSTGAAFSADGNTAVVAQFDGRIEAWQLGSLSPTALRRGALSGGDVRAGRNATELALTRDGRELLVAEYSRTGGVLTYDTKSGASRQVEFGLPPARCGTRVEWVDLLTVSSDGLYLAHRQGNCLIVRDRGTSKVLAILYEFPTSLIFRPDNSLLLASFERTSSGHGPTTVRIWEWQADRAVAVRRLPGDLLQRPHWQVASSADGRRIAVFGGSPSTLTVWDNRLHAVGELAVPDGTRSVALSADGSRLASTVGDSIVRVWDVERRTVILLLTDNDIHTTVAFTPDGRIIAGRSTAGLTIWESRPPECSQCPVKRH